MGSTIGVSEPNDQYLPPEPHDGIDAAGNADALPTRPSRHRHWHGRCRARCRRPTRRPSEAPEVEGTGAGDPLAGVHASDSDVAEAVPGDEGPEHPGVRRST